MIWATITILLSISLGVMAGYFWAQSKAEEEFFKNYMYCPTCNACGHSGCCPEGQCKQFVCVYGKSYIAEHEEDWRRHVAVEMALQQAIAITGIYISRDAAPGYYANKSISIDPKRGRDVDFTYLYNYLVENEGRMFDMLPDGAMTGDIEDE